MFEAIRRLISRGRTRDTVENGFSVDDKQLAEAALMFHVIAVDGTVTQDEREILANVLQRHFELDSEQVSVLIEEARRADQEAIDLYGFTRILKQEMTRDERLSLIANLWEMVYADGVVHEFEDNIVWRVAELLDIETRDRMELKRRIGEKMSAG